jgi:hypothetical protein
MHAMNPASLRQIVCCMVTVFTGTECPLCGAMSAACVRLSPSHNAY